MRCLDKVVVFVGSHASLSLFCIHLLQFCHSVFTNVTLDSLNDFLVVGQIRSMSFQAYHVQRRGSLEGAVDVKVLAVFGSIEICRHSSVSV